MTVETKADEELENKEVPPQEEEDDEDEEPGAAPGGGKFLSSDMRHLSFSNDEQTVQRKRRKRRNLRRRKQPSLTGDPQGSVFPNFSQVEYIRPEKSASKKTNEESSDATLYPILSPTRRQQFVENYLRREALR